MEGFLNKELLHLANDIKFQEKAEASSSNQESQFFPQPSFTNSNPNEDLVITFQQNINSGTVNFDLSEADLNQIPEEMKEEEKLNSNTRISSVRKQKSKSCETMNSNPIEISLAVQRRFSFQEKSDYIGKDQDL